MCWKSRWALLADGCEADSSGASWGWGGGRGTGGIPLPSNAGEGPARGGSELVSVGFFLGLRESCMDRFSA